MVSFYKWGGLNSYDIHLHVIINIEVSTKPYLGGS